MFTTVFTNLQALVWADDVPGERTPRERAVGTGASRPFSYER